LDRTIIYSGSVPLETDLLNTNRNTLTAIAELCQDIFGTSTVFTGLGCVPAIPAALTVTINPGRVYSLQNRDTLAYSSLPVDTVNQIVKQGIMLTAQSLACAAPGTVGFSVNYLISASFVEQDITPVVLPYYNAANPAQAFSGPGNTGTSQNTTRQDTVQLTLTPGIAAATGSQTTPATPVGTIALWVVTVANGQTTITSASIAQASGAPILTSSLLQAIQADTLNYGVDVGTVNVLQASYQLPITALIDNMNLWVKPKFTNTGACTFTPNPGVIAPAPVVGGNHSALQGNEFLATGRSNLVYRLDITSWVLVESTGGAIQAAPATASQQAVTFGQVSGVVGQVRNLSMLIGSASATGTLTADEIIVETALGGLRYCLSGFSKTINLATVGVNAGVGGMDTGAPPVSGYVALYAIYNPTTQTAALLATNAGTLQGNVYGGANMPSGYTASALVSVWPTNASKQFVGGMQNDRHIGFAPLTFLTSATPASTPTSVSISTIVPANARTFDANIALGNTVSASVVGQLYATAQGFPVGTTGGFNNAQTGTSGNSVNYISVPQTTYYTLTSTSGTPNISGSIHGYAI
jgi:hypothetical protein